MDDIDKAGEDDANKLGNNVLWVETDTSSWDSQFRMFEKGT